MIPLGVLGLMVILSGLSQALEMIVNARRNKAVTWEMYGEPTPTTFKVFPGKEER